MYAVLKPIYQRAGDYWSVSWERVGFAKDLQDAKTRHGAAPVLSKEPQWMKIN